jgi:hypothetical protein
MSIKEYIEALISRLGEGDPAALARLRQVVGLRRAWISLDDETVEVRFTKRGLEVRTDLSKATDGSGVTDRQTVLDILDARLEVLDAILLGRLRIQGDVEEINRIVLAIEILLDASTRDPALQELAEQLRAESVPRRLRPIPTRMSWHPFRPSPAEQEMLRRLDLLP